AHLKRRDIYLGWVVSLLQVMHWFNPLIWFAFRRMRTDQELACDGLVLSTMDTGEPPKYGQTLINLFERFSQVTYVPSIAGILEDTSQLKRRIKMIARFKKNSYRWSPLAVILIIVLGCVSLPDAIQEKILAKPGRHITLREVWSGPGVDFCGAPSPDGRYLSYVDWETGDLATYEFATGKKRRLTNKGSWDEPIEFTLFSRWSPDGKQIVYDWYNDEKAFADLRIIGLDVSKPRILYSNKEVVWLQTYDWSPDGKQILASFWRKDETNQIVLVSVADGSVRVLKTLDLRSPRKWPMNMSFSPDGRYIAYDFPPEAYSPERDISLLSIDGGGVIPLVEHPADDIVLGWAPDGKNILFGSDRTGNFDVWVIQIAGGKRQGTPERVKPSMGPIKPLGFTRKGSFYYGVSQDRKDIYIAELDPQAGEILAPPKRTIARFEGANQTPDYSPDGKYLAYISTRGVRSSFMPKEVGDVLCVRSLETGKDREIFSEGLRSFGYPRWSPDSRSIFVVSWVAHEDSMGIYRIDAQTGGVTRVVKGEVGGLYWHECSRDGKAIFLVRRDETKDLRQIMARDIETGMETEIYRAPGSEFFYVFSSPDGKRLSLISRSGGGGRRILKVLPATGGEPRELYKWEEDDVVSLYHTWSADGRYIFFAKRSSEKTEEEWKWSLWRIPVDGGEPQKLGLEMPQISSLSVHPDGRHIAFQSSGFKRKFAEVWVMENFLPAVELAKTN
ncbi:MAG: M56 family metallopeptidase, partial [Planctomycetota bacterium]